MSGSVGAPKPGPSLEGIFNPYSGRAGLDLVWHDDQQVTRPDPDSVSVDGRSVAAGPTAARNLKAMGRTMAQALLPDKTLKAVLHACKARHGLKPAVAGFLEGLALDAWEAVKAPLTLAKDGLEAAGWGVVAACGPVRNVHTAPPTAPQLAPPDFQEVHLRSKEQGRSGYFHYALKDGKIWSRWDPILPDRPFSFPCGEPMSPKQGQALVEGGAGPYTYAFDARRNSVVVTPRPDADRVGFKMVAGRLQPADRREAAAWHLHDGLGGPKLPEGEHVVEIQVAGDFIEARTNTNKMYSYDPTKPDPVGWKAERGCPTGGEVNLPQGIRDWTLGEAVTIKPKRACIKAMNPWTDVVGYYEDPAGRKGDFNFVATTGVLTGDGRQIRYRDTGLPADFTRGFQTPHHGRFQGERLAQAGSTWLLYGREPDGSPGLYARMLDYEINGACPGKRYSYEERPFQPDKVYSFADTVELQPLPGWQKIQFPPLQGQALVTDRLDILPTGQGNASRELRLEGRDALGTTGFYHKRLDQEDWQFQATGQPLVGRPVPVGRPDPSQGTPNPVTWDYDRANWSGDLAEAPLKGIQLLDFHPFQTPDQPSLLRFTLDSGRTVDARLRTSDGYTFFRARPEDAEVIGEGAGVPKVLAGTLEIPDEVRQSQDPEVRAFVEGYLAGLHHRENQVMVLADRDGLRLVSGWYHRNSDRGLDWVRNPRWDVVLSREARGETPFEKVADAAALRPEPSMSRQELQDLIERNLAAESTLSAEVKDRRRDHRLLWLRGQAVEVAIRGLALGGAALNLTTRIPQFAAITQLVPPLTDAHEKASWNTAWSTPAGYRRAVDTLHRNVAQARQMAGEGA